MGVRPPTNDSDEPDAIEFGIAAVDAYLDEASLSFPATRAEVADALGDRRVAYDASGHDVALSTVLSETDRERFENEHQLLDAMYPVFEDYRRGRSGSVVDQFRSLLPF